MERKGRATRENDERRMADGETILEERIARVLPTIIGGCAFARADAREEWVEGMREEKLKRGEGRDEERRE